MNTTAIAQHLNILDSAIIEVQEWASVIWVKFVGGCRFVSKKINEAKKMSKLTIIDGKGFGATIVHEDGHSEYYSQLSGDLYIVGTVLGNYYDYQHCLIALDAGGEVIDSSTSKWGETRLHKVSVDSDKLIEYCQKLEKARNPRAGMMQTSTGEWVMADDWDRIECCR